MATVDWEGLATGVGEGTAIITAMSEGISAEATLVVEGTGASTKLQNGESVTDLPGSGAGRE